MKIMGIRVKHPILQVIEVHYIKERFKNNKHVAQ